MATTISYRPIDKRDAGQVEEILHTTFFGPDEGDPISKVLKYEAPRETKCYVDGIMPHVLADGVSVVGVDSTSGEVAGIRLCHHVTLKDSKDVVLLRSDPDMKKMWITMDIVKQASNGIDIYERYQVSEYLRFLAMAVKPEFRRLGIAKQLVCETFKLAKGKGIPVVVATATSNYSKKVFDKLGFETLKETRYVDYMIDGKPFCAGSDMSDHEYCFLCAKRL